MNALTDVWTNDLDRVEWLLNRGDFSVAREAIELLLAAEGDEKSGWTGRLLLLQARALFALSHFSRAREAAQRALVLIEGTNQPHHEIEALSLLANVSALMDYQGEALECAVLATKLAEELAEAGELARASNYLGIVELRMGAFDEASRHFADAYGHAVRASDQQLAVITRVNGRWGAMWRSRWMKYYGSLLDSTSTRPIRASGNEALCQEYTDSTALDGTYGVMAKCFSAIASAFDAAWSGTFDTAHELLDRARTVAESADGRMLALHVRLAEAEVSFEQGNLDEARVIADETHALAMAVDHRHIAILALALTALIADSQGDHKVAHDRLTTLVQEQRKSATIQAQARRQVALWRVEARARQRDLALAKQQAADTLALALTDSLTQLPNRRAFDNALSEAMNRECAGSSPRWLVVLDLDGFKGINDQFGHLIGDRVLVEVARVLRESVRPTDFAARLGGDEFVALVEAETEVDARGICERISARLSSVPWSTFQDGLTVSISAGVSACTAQSTLAETIADADAAMYRDKRTKTIAL